jgi:DNA-binding IclR family transcriptional regulator
LSGLSRDDFSNLKTFTAPARNGQRRAVYVRQVGDKRWRIAVTTGKRLVALTSAIGLETMTIS